MQTLGGVLQKSYAPPKSIPQYLLIYQKYADVGNGKKMWLFWGEIYMSADGVASELNNMPKGFDKSNLAGVWKLTDDRKVYLIW